MKKICYTLLLSIHAGYARITATVDLSQVTAPAPRQVYEYMRVAKKLPPADSLESLSDNQNRMALVSNKLNAPGKLDFTTTIYPNPSNSVFNVNMTSTSKAPALLMIINNAGNVIYSTKINAGTYYQIGQNLTPGIYYTHISQGTQHKTMKVVKQ